MWVGCFVADDWQTLSQGQSSYGHTTQTCAETCGGYRLMALRGGGQCVCGDEQPLEYNHRFDGSCGRVCQGEAALTPTRYCGAEGRNAVYRLKAVGPRPKVGDDQDQDTEDLVGAWLFGIDGSKCFISKTNEGTLRFGVPLPKGHTAFGILQPTGPWLQCELTSDDGARVVHVGTIRLHLLAPGTLVSNFMYPGETKWGKDTLAQKAKPSIPATTMLTVAPTTTTFEPPVVRTWQVVTSHGLNVRSQADMAAEVLGTKWKGTVVRGLRRGNWVDLTDEAGFMMVSSGGKVFLQMISRAADASLGPTTVGPASAAGGPWLRVVTTTAAAATSTVTQEASVETWVVATKHGLNVRSHRGRTATVLGTRVQGALLRGRQIGSWIMLRDEPGFVMISDGENVFLKPMAPITTAPTTTTPFQTLSTWTVYEHYDLPGALDEEQMDASDLDAVRRRVATRGYGGFSVQHGRAYLKSGGAQLTKDDLLFMGVAARVSFHIYTPLPRIRRWQVVARQGVSVLSAMDPAAPMVAIKVRSALVRGRLEGPWLVLVDEPGFMLVRSGAQDVMQMVKSSTTTVTSTVTSTRTLSSTVTSTRTSTVTSTRTVSSTVTSTRTSTTPIGLCEGNCSKKPASLSCLSWHRQGCREIKVRDTCLGSLDGRRALRLQGRRVHGQPCVWCGGRNCTQEGHLCEPFDFANHASAGSKLNYALASCDAKPHAQLFCFSLMMSSGYEPQLLRAQISKGVGIFACDDYLVFSSANISLGPWNSIGEDVVTVPIEGSLTVPLGGKWHTALNAGVFIRVWRAVARHGAFEGFDWTVKVDPDSVFFPERLRDSLRSQPMASVPLLQRDARGRCGECKLLDTHNDASCPSRVQRLERQGESCEAALNATSTPWPGGCGCSCGASSCTNASGHGAMYLVNCQFGLHGPIEVLSREAVKTFIRGLGQCEGLRPHPWGEDKYLDHCLVLLGIRRVERFELLSETACGTQPVHCDSSNVAFHPFKDVQRYFDCWGFAHVAGIWPEGQNE